MKLLFYILVKTPAVSFKIRFKNIRCTSKALIISGFWCDDVAYEIRKYSQTSIISHFVSIFNMVNLILCLIHFCSVSLRSTSDLHFVLCHLHTHWRIHFSSRILMGSWLIISSLHWMPFVINKGLVNLSFIFSLLKISWIISSKTSRLIGIRLIVHRTLSIFCLSRSQ